MIKKMIVILFFASLLSGCGVKQAIIDNQLKAETAFFESQTVDNVLIENFNIGYDKEGWFISGDVKNILGNSRYVASIQIKLFDAENNLVTDTYFYIGRNIESKEILSMNILVMGDLSSVTRAEFAVE